MSARQGGGRGRGGHVCSYTGLKQLLQLFIEEKISISSVFSGPSKGPVSGNTRRDPRYQSANPEDLQGGVRSQSDGRYSSVRLQTAQFTRQGLHS